MLGFINRIIEWVKSLFWKEEMELTLVGLQNSGKTTFVNVIAVSWVYVPNFQIMRATPPLTPHGTYYGGRYSALGIESL